jgi:hypothetical protein
MRSVSSDSSLPSAGVVLGSYGIAQAALDLDAENKREQEVTARDLTHLGKREQRWSHGCGGMNDGTQVRIVEIKDIAACGIEEGGAQRIDPFRAANNGRLAAFREHHERRERVLDRVLPATSQRGSDEVQDRALPFVPHRLRKLLPSRAADKAAERLRDVCWCCHFSVPPTGAPIW